MRRTLAFLAATSAIATAARAQSVATMRLTADGQSAVTVAPGTSIHVGGTLSWTMGPQTGGMPTQNLLAGIKGDMLITGNAGAASNLTSSFTHGGLVNLGTFVGGSRLGLDIAGIHGFWGPPAPPPWNWSAGVNVAAYDLVLTDPGLYTLEWRPAPHAPFVRVFPVPTSPAFTGIPTTYLSATITVTPAPTSVVPLLLAIASTRRRRRRAPGDAA